MTVVYVIFGFECAQFNLEKKRIPEKKTTQKQINEWKAFHVLKKTRFRLVGIMMELSYSHSAL